MVSYSPILPGCTRHAHHFLHADAPGVVALPASGPGMHLSSVFPNSGLGPGRAELAKHLTNVKRMIAFGHPLHMATLTFKGLGLYAARRHVLKLPEALNHTHSSGNVTTTDHPLSTNAAKIFSVRSACVNPIIGKKRFILSRRLMDYIRVIF